MWEAREHAAATRGHCCCARQTQGTFTPQAHTPARVLYITHLCFSSAAKLSADAHLDGFASARRRENGLRVWHGTGGGGKKSIIKWTIKTPVNLTPDTRHAQTHSLLRSPAHDASPPRPRLEKKCLSSARDATTDMLSVPREHSRPRVTREVATQKAHTHTSSVCYQVGCRRMKPQDHPLETRQKSPRRSTNSLRGAGGVPRWRPLLSRLSSPVKPMRVSSCVYPVEGKGGLPPPWSLQPRRFSCSLRYPSITRRGKQAALPCHATPRRAMPRPLCPRLPSPFDSLHADRRLSGCFRHRVVLVLRGVVHDDVFTEHRQHAC